MQSKAPAIEAKPFLKWAGSKKWLIPHVMPYIPKKFNRYYEPFLGSGALYFALQPEKAVLSDLNGKLIATYEALRDHPGRVISELRKMPYDKDFYYKHREIFNNGVKSKIKQAAYFIYFNRTAWNGLYRENSSGGFNVPIGSYDNPKICDEENIKLVSKVLERVTFKNGDFVSAVNDARKGDLVFFDPPYITGHRNNGFHSYNKKLFSWEDQERLFEAVCELKQRGCHVMVTNACHDSLKKLYRGFTMVELSRKSLIAADINNRKAVSELLIHN